MKIAIEQTIWEKDFLLNEILPKGEVVEVPKYLMEQLDSHYDVFIFSSRIHCFYDIKETIKKVKPKVIILLSDEFYQDNRWDYNMLGNYCELFLRHYHQQYYNYTPNTLHIPLGYTNGCKAFSLEKKYDWSFIGEIKKDREEMLNVFSQLPNHFIGDKIKSEKMCEIYSQSTFVPCGRGNSSLDCFRLYEASMNVAIPVVVGSEEEIKCTFKYEENPPWIFADTWEEAFYKCKSLLNNRNQLKEQQQNLLNWWYNRISDIKSKVLEVL